MRCTPVNDKRWTWQSKTSCHQLQTIRIYKNCLVMKWEGRTLPYTRKTLLSLQHLKDNVKENVVPGWNVTRRCSVFVLLNWGSWHEEKMWHLETTNFWNVWRADQDSPARSPPRNPRKRETQGYYRFDRLKVSSCRFWPLTWQHALSSTNPS